MSDPIANYDPTEKTIHTEPHDDHFGTWNDKVFINGSGLKKVIGISDGCVLRVLPIEGWLNLAEEVDRLKAENEEQARLLGISGSKEARLLSRIVELEQALTTIAARKQYSCDCVDECSCDFNMMQFTAKEALKGRGEESRGESK